MLKVQKTRTGLPLLQADGSQAPVTGEAEGKKWTVAKASREGDLFTDPACPPGTSVTYRQAGKQVTYQWELPTLNALLSSTGRNLYKIRITSADNHEISAGEAAITLASGKTTYRLPLSPPPLKGDLTFVCAAAESAELRDRIRHGEILYLLHSKALCEIPGCMRPRSQPIRVIGAARESRMARTDSAYREFSFTWETPEIDESKGKAATMQEACSLNLTCGLALAEIARKVNGVE